MSTERLLLRVLAAIILVPASKWIGGHHNGPGQIEPEGFHRGRSHHPDGHLHRAPARAGPEQAPGYARGRRQQTASQLIGSDDHERAASSLPALEPLSKRLPNDPCRVPFSRRILASTISKSIQPNSPTGHPKTRE